MGHLEPWIMTNVKPAGACPECGVAHKSTSPHNQRSLTYQYKFYNQHGRWPTWADAMVHCSDTTKQFWAEELAKYGIEVER